MKKIFLLLLLCVAAFSVAAGNGERELTVMTYNLRFGELASMERLASEIRAANPDFVALQEVDVNTMREISKGNNCINFINRLAELTGMFGFYGRTINFAGGYYGIGILSKHPAVKVEKIDLPNPKNVEPRIMLVGQFELDGIGHRFTFACTHFDYLDPNTITAQARAAIERLRTEPQPLIVAGDFNSEPESAAIGLFTKDFKLLTGEEKTFPAKAPEKKLDWIFGYPAADFTLVGATVPKPSIRSASDHLPIVSKIKVKF